MSRHSKIKRQARLKREGGRPIRRLGAPLQPHAKLVDDAGHVVGGGGLRDREWQLLLGGRVVTATESPALLLAMLRHTQAVLRDERALKLEVSPELLNAATAEAEAHGHTLEAHLALLEQERAERDSDASDPASLRH
ncbi:MAG TPA: hypothetical protein VEY50_12560 [Lysobacter sp.]|nr:hypothetical protein [Lysobacter sp.]